MGTPEVDNHLATTDQRAKPVPRLAVGYLGFAVVSVAVAVMLGPIGFPFLWLALSLAVVSLAFWTGWTSLLGKRLDGTLSPLSVLVLLPYYLFVWGFFYFKCLWMRRNEPCWHEVEPGILVGRRPRRGELPPGIELNVDLTSEFRELPEIVSAASYRSLPILNRSVPGIDAFFELVDEAAGCSGDVYIHCGAGRGRATMFAAALLLRKGAARDVDDAIAKVAKARPGTLVHPEQKQCIDQLQRMSLRPGRQRGL